MLKSVTAFVFALHSQPNSILLLSAKKYTIHPNQLIFHNT